MDLAGAVAALPPCEMVVAYGSGVFGQGAKSEADPTRLTDLLVVVRDGAAWHRANQAANSEHYPPWLRGRPERAARLQRWGGAHMLFFPFVRLDSLACKYGVIEAAALRRDLDEWDALYCSGRLHKPVRLALEPAAETGLAQAMERNCGSAVSAAVALLSVSGRAVASEEEVFLEIARLSYEGDVRMAVGEDPNKVTNIVRSNLAAFSALYRGHLERLLRDGTLAYGRPVSAAAGAAEIARLPPRFRQLQPAQLQRALAQTVRRSSFVQTAKNALTAGLGKSISYGVRKIGKRFL